MAKATQHIEIVNDTFTIPQQDGKKLVYIPSNTGKLFHNDENLVRLIMGPYGSGKSTICMAEIVRQACKMKPWKNGVRRSKWAIIRNTCGELESTTLQTWLAWFGELGYIEKRKKPILTYLHVFNDGYGIVELELLFMALDREADLGKLRSLELTGCYINELSEIPEGALVHLKGRINRYPSENFCTDYWSGIIADTNPPDIDHWIYRDFENTKNDNSTLFKQPPGLIKDESRGFVENIHADNYKHIKENYYLDMANGANEEFIKVFCLGQYGTVILGKAVYPEYNDDFHAKEDVVATPGIPLHLGFDFGLTPACIIVQMMPSGQLKVLDEIISEDMGIERMVEMAVIPHLSKYYSDYEIESVVGDPSGAARKDTDESACLQKLIEYGFPASGAPSNSLVKRIGSVQYFLTRMTSGQPAFIMNKHKCLKLRKGFLGDYHYKRLAVSGESRYHDVPNKNSSSHVHDALQYIALSFVNQNLNNDISETVNKIRSSAFRL